jgi:hypothetical protein
MDYLDLVDDLAEADTFGAGKNGFTEGTTGTTPRTLIRPAGFLNPVLREIMNVIEEGGVTPSAADLTQLADGIRGIIYLTPHAMYGIDSQTIAAGGATLTLINQVGGFSLVTSNEIEVPSAGTYEVHVGAKLTHTSVSNPSTLGLELWLGGGTGYGPFTTQRFSASASDHVYLHFTRHVVITTPATQRINLQRSANGIGVDNAVNQSNITVRRIG